MASLNKYSRLDQFILNPIMFLVLCSFALGACHQLGRELEGGSNTLTNSQKNDRNKPVTQTFDFGNGTEDIQQSQSLKGESPIGEVVKPLDFNVISRHCADRLKNIEIMSGSQGWQGLESRPAA
ncbi:MAG: hypothetical protein KDD62_11775, partial [Bdellovibrionales bacterium]|nr:hypothetical protein [Bdellovibrionales bacterium]